MPVPVVHIQGVGHRGVDQRGTRRRRFPWGQKDRAGTFPKLAGGKFFDDACHRRLRSRDRTRENIGNGFRQPLPGLRIALFNIRFLNERQHFSHRIWGHAIVHLNFDKFALDFLF